MPQLAYHASHPGGRFGSVLLFSGLLVIPLIWRRRLPLCTFACVTVVALVQWIADVEVSADLTLLIYLYTVASRYPMPVAALAAGVFEVGAPLAARARNSSGYFFAPATKTPLLVYQTVIDSLRKSGEPQVEHSTNTTFSQAVKTA